MPEGWPKAIRFATKTDKTFNYHPDSKNPNIYNFFFHHLFFNFSMDEISTLKVFCIENYKFSIVGFSIGYGW